MQPIYELDGSVRDDVAKLRADSHIKGSTGEGRVRQGLSLLQHCRGTGNQT